MNNMKLKKVNETSCEVSDIENLYLTAFPEHERRPLLPLLTDKKGFAETFAILENEEFIGLGSFLVLNQVAHLIFFAIREEMRGKGFGSKALKLFEKFYAGKIIIADIETPERDSNNFLQRTKRKKFYLANGYKDSGIKYKWRGESYEILVSGGEITEEEFESFWRFFEINNLIFKEY